MRRVSGPSLCRKLMRGRSSPAGPARHASRAIAVAVFVGVAASLPGRVPAADALINVAPPVPSSAVDITAQGVVWSDEHGLFRLVTPAGVVRVLGAGGQYAGTGPVDPIAGRGDWVAALADGGRSGSQVLVSRLPHGLHAPAGGSPVGPGGCRDWAANPAPLENLGGQIAFALSGHELVLAGTPICKHAAPPGPRPLFARSLPGGAWHVLRWIPDPTTPILATGGPWLAIGAPTGKDSTSVDVINAHTGRLRNHVTLPGAYASLALDHSGLLVASVLRTPPAPLPPPPGSPPGARPVTQAGVAGYAPIPPSRYLMYWVAAGSRRLQPLRAAIAAAAEPRWVLSDGRLAYVESNNDKTGSNPNGTATLVVTDLRTRTTRQVIGFDDTRELLALDFAGSRLAWVQTESTLLPPSMWSCTTGPLAIGPRTLQILDLRNPPSYIPAPPVPVLPASTLLCPQGNQQ